MLYQEGHSLEAARGENKVVVKCPRCGREFVVMLAGKSIQVCMRCSKERETNRVPYCAMVA